MTNQEFISLLSSSKKLDLKYVSDIKNVLEYYPYFTIGHLVYLKAIHQNNDINFDEILSKTVLYVKNPQWLHNYIFSFSNEKKIFHRNTKKSGDYFDIIAELEEKGGDVKQSLAELAENLKKAKLATSGVFQVNENLESIQPVAQSQQSKHLNNIKSEIDYTDKIRFLMQQRKYEEALGILKELNLNNPKKSIYFADQIRFLEKIVENLKK